MLPTPSRLSVSTRPVGRFRPWCSSGYLRISPLHPEFHRPLRASRRAVYHDLAIVRTALSHGTYPSACARFTPSKSGQRLPPTYYRGCWHVVSRGLLVGYCRCHPPQKEFTTREPSSSTRRCSVRLAPIAENSLLLPPVGVWAVSQSQSGWSSSQTSHPS